LNLGGTGINPRTVFVFVLVLVPSGDIFYCSGSRQLNHSSFIFEYFFQIHIFHHYGTPTRTSRP